MISIMFQAHQAFHEKIDNSAVNQVAEAVAYGVGRMARTMSQDYARNPYPCIDIGMIMALIIYASILDNC